MFTHIRRGLAVLVVLGWVTGCSDLGAPLRLLPRAELSATALDFGTIAVGDSAVRQLNLGNSGNAALNSAATLSCPDFRIRSGGGAFSVAPGAVHIVEVVFVASGVGSAACALQLGADLPAVPLTGVGALQAAGAAGQLTTGALDFGSLSAGQFAELSFRIRSTGTAPLRVDVSGACSEFAIVSGGGPAIVAPGDSLAVTVRFTPVTGGHHTCTISTGPGLPDVSLAGDATTVSFATDIVPIFQSNLCYDNCHFFQTRNDVVNVTSTLGYAPARLVVPFDLAASVLYNKIANTHVYGPAMPQGSAGLPATQRDKIRAWILEGALDN